MTDIDKLRKAALAATPGPWECWGDQVGVDHRHQTCCGQGYEECCGNPIVEGDYGPIANTSENDARFIALANPANVLALLDDRERLREALGQLRKSATLLQQNAEGCAVNHHGEDFAIQGMPGWLADTAADIGRATAALAASGGGNG